MLIHVVEAGVNLVASPPELIPAWCALPEKKLRGNGAGLCPVAGVPVAEDLRNIQERGRLAILVAMGSSANRRPVLDVTHSASRADVEIISPSAVCLSEADRETLPGNVHVTGWIPVHRLGDLVDVAITHGGEGTVQTSCSRGWPFIGIPLQLEQRYDVMRCVAFGDVRLVSSKKASRTGWAKLVVRQLADRMMWEAADRMVELCDGLDGPGRCADVIRNHLKGQG